MKVTLLMILLALVQQISSLQYKPIKTIPLPTKFTKLTFSQDQKTMIGYTPNIPKGYIFNGHTFTNNYTPLTLCQDLKISNFGSYLNQNVFVYGCGDGYVGYSILVMAGEDREVAVGQMNQMNVGCEVKGIQYSNDAQKLAVFCEGGSKVFVVDGINLDHEKVVVEFGGEVKSISWHPTELKLLIGGNNPNNSTTGKLSLYDLTNNYSETSFPTTSPIYSTSFSQDGQKIATTNFYSQIQKEQQISIFQIIKPEQISYLIAFNCSSLTLERHAQFLSAWDGSKFFVWVFDGISMGEFSGSAFSVLTPNGGQIIEIKEDTNGSSLFLLGFCPQYNTTYSPSTSQCQNCTIPCNSCHQNPSKCTTCQQQYYISVYQCLKCLQNCQNCVNNKNLLKIQKKCQKCSDKLVGCLECKDKDICVICDENQNWVLANGSCRCADGCFKKNNTCIQCQVGCEDCLNETYCNFCDDTKNFGPFPIQGKCSCQQNYYLNNKICERCNIPLKGCLTCINSTKCTSCNQTENRTLEKYKCKCSKGYYEEELSCKNCEAVIEGCYLCNNGNECQKCDKGKGWIKDGKRCGCKQGYVSKKGTCNKCSKLMTGCLKCSNSNWCEQCDETFIKDSLKCVCPQGQQYSNIDQKCHDTPKYTIWIVIGVLVGVGIIGVVVFLIHRKKRGEPDYRVSLRTTLQNQEQG